MAGGSTSRRAVVAAELYTEADRLWILLADPREPEEPRVARLPIRLRELEVAAELVRSGELTSVAAEVVIGVCNRLLAGLQPLLEGTGGSEGTGTGGGALVLAPHGPLHFLPLGAAETRAGTALAEALPVATVPSTSFLRRLAAGGAERGLQPACAALLAGPDLGGEELVAGVAEALSFRLQSVLPEGRLRVLERPAKLEPGTAVAIVAHGRAGSGGSGQSRLLMRDRRGRPAWIGADRVAASLGPAAFAFLSVCRSSTAAVGADDEPTGLVWPLLAGGCRCVVSSLWDVEPTAAAAFAARFFDSLHEGETAGRALGRAMGRQRGDPRFPNLRDWGGFVLYGDWRWRLNRRAAPGRSRSGS